MKTCVYGTLVVIVICLIVVVYEIGVEGQKTLTYACMTLLLREKFENLYLSSKGKKVHFRWLTSQKFNASQWLCKISAIFPFFDVTALFSCTWTIPDMVKIFAVLGSKNCPVASCSITIHANLHSPGLKIVCLQRHGLIFWINPWWMAGKYMSYDAICHFQNIEKEWSYPKINIILARP